MGRDILKKVEYYDINKTLSKQRLFSFVIGGRGMGKTYSSKKKGIDNFLRKGQQFVYIRRYDTDLKASEIRNFFDDICEQYPGVDFKASNGLFKINGEVAGWYFPLSTASTLRSVPFPNVSLIIFDEFLVSDGIHRYLPGEVTMMLDCYSTISRDRDVPIVFMSNAITVTNPYFLYFDVNFEKGQTTKLTDFISIEFVRSESYEQHMSSTKFGQMIAGTAYGNYHINNQFLFDTNTFIEKMQGTTNSLCTFVINGTKIGMHSANDDNRIYLASNVDPTNQRIFTMDMSDHNSETNIALKSNPFIRVLISKYCDGNLRFTNQNVKNICTPAIKKLL